MTLKEIREQFIKKLIDDNEIVDNDENEIFLKCNQVGCGSVFSWRYEYTEFLEQIILKKEDIYD
jgi:uncharacterized C2H2 Zn-finger protein